MHYYPRLRQVHGERPFWLRNPKTGRPLELDLQFPTINVAIEIDGIQHGRYIKGMQRDFQSFRDQQQRDRDKIEQCKTRGITLYKLTIFDLTQRRFAPFLTQFEIAHGLSHDRYLDPPMGLFAEAERLSRAKVVKRRYRQPGLWPLLKRIYG
jgi:hypothetical protein